MRLQTRQAPRSLLQQSVGRGWARGGVSAAASIEDAAMSIIALAALAFPGFRLRHRNIDKIVIKEAESETTPSASSLDQPATSETSSAP